MRLRNAGVRETHDNEPKLQSRRGWAAQLSCASVPPLLVTRGDVADHNYQSSSQPGVRQFDEERHGDVRMVTTPAVTTPDPRTWGSFGPRAGATTARTSMLTSHTAGQVKRAIFHRGGNGLLTVAKPGLEPAQMPPARPAFDHRLDLGQPIVEQRRAIEGVALAGAIAGAANGRRRWWHIGQLRPDCGLTVSKSGA
jgi:hypothetical protein